MPGYLRARALRLKEALQEPCGEARRALYEAVEPVASDLEQGPLATFAKRSQTVRASRDLKSFADED